jgi:MFS family permease
MQGSRAPGAVASHRFRYRRARTAAHFFTGAFPPLGWSREEPGLHVLRHPSFRALWLGQTVSGVGDSMVLVALALYVTRKTGSPRDVGLVLGAATTSLILFLLVGGVWADRLPRRRLMIGADLVRFAAQATLAALIFADRASVPAIMAVEFAYGAAEAFFRPAYTGLIPQTVPEELIQPANALSQTSVNAGQLVGPALATALVVGVGAGWAFAADAATFLVSAAFLMRVRPRDRGAPVERSSIVRELIGGYREVRSRTWVWVTIVVFTGSLMVGLAPWLTLGPTVADDRYGSEAVFGLVATAVGLGTLAGALVGLRWRPGRPLRAAFVAIGAWPLMIAAFALGLPRGVVYPVAVGCGFGFALFGIWWETSLAQRIPPASLSRVTSWDWMGSLALLPLGYVLAGVIADAVGARTVLLAGAGITATLILLGLLPRQTRELGAQPTGEPAVGALAARP